MLKFGIKGAKGDAGEDGEQGIDGINGVQGIQGIQGIQGVQGEQGLPGLPYDSRFSVTRNADQPVGITTYSRVNFNIENYDNNSEYDNVTNFRWTAKTTGLYSIGSFIQIHSINAGKLAYIDVLKNGSTIVLSDSKKNAVISNCDLLAYGDIELAAEDYLEVWVYHNDTAVKYLDVADKCRFWGHRIA